MTCRHCMNWNLKSSTMARAGLANCNLQVSRAVFYPAHDCKAFKTVTAVQAAARDAWLKGVGL